MTESEVKDKILVLFNQKRQSPNQKFDESHFMDFLTNPPSPKNTIKNSFKGAKRYYRFMDCLEVEFKICFPLEDLDKYYSIDSLTKKVVKRIDKGKGNQMILNNRMKDKDKFWFEIVLFLIPVSMFIWLGVHWLPIAMSVVSGLLIRWTLTSKLYARKHNSTMTSIFSGMKN